MLPEADVVGQSLTSFGDSEENVGQVFLTNNHGGARWSIYMVCAAARKEQAVRPKRMCGAQIGRVPHMQLLIRADGDT